ncbi:hypothetical protein ATANTOWER_009844 [Ataeniobius toweri]|uniref:Uncharacterized protein n=1 Tax=Ataeniobius toweri TaxID=208326 RepID=A0ABU7AXP2_9TELE|nr:hypothetical protein [Ataeniobius toweri]
MPRLRFLSGRRPGGIEEVFEVLCPPTHNFPSSGQQHTLLTVNSVSGVPLPPLRRWMVDQNRLKAIRKSFSMASPNSSHAQLFASTTTRATCRLDCQYHQLFLESHRPKRPDRTPSSA